MIPSARIVAVALMLAAAVPAAAAGGITPSAPAMPMLPARTLECVVGRATNIDPSINQTTDEIIYEGSHRFALFLPSIPMRQGPPPDPSDDWEPVHPDTRILADPDRVAKGGAERFDRVIDLWPNRVEMLRIVRDPTVHLIIVSAIDEAAGVADIYMTRANDAASMDFANIYQGKCRIAVGGVASARS